MFKSKVKYKLGASDMVIVLIMIVIFSSVGFLVFKGIGSSSKEAGANISGILDDSVGESNFKGGNI